MADSFSACRVLQGVVTAPVLDADPLTVVAGRLGQLLVKPPAAAAAMRLAALEPARAPRTVIAVDGSSVVLGEPGPFLVGAYRAATVRFEDGRPAKVDLRDPHLVLLERERPDGTLRERLMASGHDGERCRPSELLHLLREHAELEAALGALETLGPGDALLLDGPFQARPFPTLARRILSRATARGVDVVGVCKSTSLAIEGVPALAACHLAARERRLGRWHAALDAPAHVLGQVHVAALSPAERRAFRFDCAPADGDCARLLGSLVPLALHPAYPGYPVALALAHNAVTMREDVKLQLLARLQDEAHRLGVREDAWRAAFEDYHDILDLGA